MNRSLFRMLVIAFALLLLGSVVVEMATQSMLPEPLKTYVLAESEGDLTGRELAFLAALLPLVLVELVAVVGLCLFQNWARWLFLVATVLSLLLTPFAGHYVTSGPAEAVNYFVYLLNGVVLACAFCSSLSGDFGRDKAT
jgi:hypothetical protein